MQRMRFSFLLVIVGAVAILTSKSVAQSTWQTFGGDAQHTALSGVRGDSVHSILWQTPVDLMVSGDAIHYGSPIFTPNNTVVVPVKTGLTDGFEVKAFNGATGALIYTQATDYSLPP